MKRLADGGFFDSTKKTKSQLGHMLSEKFRESSKEEWASHTSSPFLHSICKLFNYFDFKLVERGALDTESFAAKLFDTGNFNPSSAYSSSRLLEDLGDPKLGELLYSD